MEGWRNRISGQLSSVKPPSTCLSAALWAGVSVSVAGGWRVEYDELKRC